MAPSVRGKKKKNDASARGKKKGASQKSVRNSKDKPTPSVSARSTKGKKKGNTKKMTAAQVAAAAQAKKEQEDRERASREAAQEVDPEDKEDEPPRKLPAFMNDVTDAQKKAYAAFAKQIFAQGVEGLKSEFNDNIKPYQGTNVVKEIFQQNVALNRYKDIVCNDNTRVVVDDGKGTDYIHANWVRGDPLFNEFICTQGPIPGTINDFWRMIVHTKSYHIIMLCDVIENQKIKCEQYWPAQHKEKITYGDITVEHVSQNAKDLHVCKTLLKVTCGDFTMTVRHHLWRTWPDRSVPKSTKAVLRILRTVRISPRPIIVHCSAGVGRTGTLVAVEMCLQKLLSSLTLNMLDICKKLRDQRSSSVQMDMQYCYLAVAVIEYGKAMEYIDNPEINEEFAKFKAELEFNTQPQQSAPKKSSDA